jgi:hypothetical protein
MKKRALERAMAFLLTCFILAAVPLRAQDVDEKIRAVERELWQLKQQQMELTREASTAAEALPAFSYRSGNGVMIEAADRAWSVRTGIEIYLRMLFESGKDEAGRTNGEIMGRRLRPYFVYCINNCLYEIELIVDLDGFGNGNAKNSTNTGVDSILHRGVVHFNLGNINPWLPTIDLGMDISTSISNSRRGSSFTGSQLEYDLLSRNNGFNTGRAGNGIALNWDNKSLSDLGIPGRISRLQLAIANVGEGDDGLSSFTDRKDFVTYFSVQPFSQIKNKWIQGLDFEIGAWFCNNDPRPGTDNACDRLRIRDHGDGGRQELFDTGSGSVGRGLAIYITPGLTWTVGPYRLRAMLGFQSFADEGGTRGRKRGRNFLIGHDLFLWSPNGFFTGSATTPGSVLVGTHFERNDVSCENVVLCSSINGGQFHRNRILLREWDLWYFIANRMSVGAGVLWYDASNLRTGKTRAGENLGVFRRNCGSACAGRGGDWTDVSLNWRFQF